MHGMDQSNRILALIQSGHLVVQPQTSQVFRINKNGSCIPIATHVENGYLRVSLTDQIGSFNAKVHRIVWIWVHGLPKNDLVVCHRDNDKQNNHIDNLFLQTKAKNLSDARISGLVKTWKLRNDQRWLIYDLFASGATVNELAQKFNVNAMTIRRVIRRIRDFQNRNAFANG